MSAKPITRRVFLAWACFLTCALMPRGTFAAPPPTLVLFPRTLNAPDDVRALVDVRKKLRDAAVLDVLTYDPNSAAVKRAAADAHHPEWVSDDMSRADERLALTRALGANFYAVVSRADGRGKTDAQFVDAVGNRAWNGHDQTTGDSAKFMQTQAVYALTHPVAPVLSAPALPARTVILPAPPRQTQTPPVPIQAPAPATQTFPSPFQKPPWANSTPPFVPVPLLYSNPKPPSSSPAPTPAAKMPTPRTFSPTPRTFSPTPRTFLPTPQTFLPTPRTFLPTKNVSRTPAASNLPPAATNRTPENSSRAPAANNLPPVVTQATPLVLPALPKMAALPPVVSPLPTRSLPLPAATTPVPAATLTVPSPLPIPAPATLVLPATPPVNAAPASDPDADLPSVKATLNKGDAALSAGDFVEAIADYRDAINRAPLSIVPRLRLAAAYLQSGRRDKALDEAQRALQIVPASAAAQQFLMQIDAETGSSDGAVARYTALTGQNPSDPAAHLALGDALWNNGRLAQAEDEYKAAGTLAVPGAPQTAQAAAGHLARLYAAQGRYDDSLTALKDAGAGGYALALGIVQSRADTVHSALDAAQGAFDAGRSTHEKFYKAATDAAAQTQALAEFVVKVVPPAAFKVSHLHRVLATHLLAQQAAVLVTYVETADAALADQAARLDKEAQTEMLTAHAAEQRLGLWNTPRAANRD